MKFTKEIRIALVAILGIVVLFYGLKFLKGMAMFHDDDTYYIQFDDVSGLGVSSPIFAEGYQVGVVESVMYDFNHKEPTKVSIGLNKKMKLPEGTEAVIESDMLGNVRVSLLIGPAGGKLLKPGDTIQGHINGGAMSKLSAMLPALEKMVPKLDSIMGSVNTLLADPSIAKSVHNVENITTDLTTSTKQLNTLLAELNRDMPRMMTKADTVLNNTSEFTGSLANVDVEGTMKKLESTIENLQSLTAQLSSGDGTLGKLMRDRQLYDNLNTTVQAADSLLTDLKANPKRYVHFSVFGKKNK